MTNTLWQNGLFLEPATSVILGLQAARQTSSLVNPSKLSALYLLEGAEVGFALTHASSFHTLYVDATVWHECDT